MTEIKMLLVAGGQTYDFHGIVHEINSTDEFHLDCESFYKKIGEGVPETPHYEIEIISPNHEFFKKHKLNVHEAKHGKRIFMCYPARISSIREANQVFLVWSMGSALRASGGPHLNDVFKEAGNDFLRAEEMLKEKYGVIVS